MMIKLKNLSKKFKDVELYKNVDYIFKDNKLTCFYGASGSGKSTLLNLIAGFDTDYEGDIEVEKINLKNLNKNELCKFRFNNIGFVFQDYNLLNGYTALENVMIAIELQRDISKEEKLAMSAKILYKLGLKDNMNQKVETLSGGQKQRVSIARALINNPKIILADEPTGALDEESKVIIMDILKEISKIKTVVIITHDEEVAKYADEIIELKDFKLYINEHNGITKEDASEVSFFYDECDKWKFTNEKLNVSEEQDIGSKYESENKNYDNLKQDEKGIIEDKNQIRIRNRFKDPKISKNFLKKISFKNFKIHFFKTLIAALIIALGTASFISSLSFKDLTNNAINNFKTKNFFYTIGQVRIDDSSEKAGEKEIEKVLENLKKDEKIDNIYIQYSLIDLNIEYGSKKVNIPMKTPTIISKESMAYGMMPNPKENEIAIPLNIANRLLSEDFTNIIGKEITLKYKDKNGEEKRVKLKVSGITNSQYQDFILSSNVEKEIYENIEKDESKNRFIVFNIKEFEEISEIDKEFKDNKIEVFTRTEEVEGFLNSFKNLVNLYTVVSYIMLIVAIVISVVILLKIISQRYKEIGTLGALGYINKNIRKILFRESKYFALLSISLSIIMLYLIKFIYEIQFGHELPVRVFSVLLLIILNLILTIGISYLANSKLIKIDPAIALRK